MTNAVPIAAPELVEIVRLLRSIWTTGLVKSVAVDDADQERGEGADFAWGRSPDSAALIAIKKLSPVSHGMQA
jgi:hypothetical protein